MALPASPTVAEFAGPIRLSYDSFSAADMQEMIDEIYPEMLRAFLGQYAFEWLESNELTSEWQKLFDGGAYTDRAGELQYMQGFKKSAMYMLYFTLLRDSNWINTAVGNVQNVNENSTPQSQGNMASVAVSSYNKGVKWFDGVIDYIRSTAYFETNFEDMRPKQFDFASVI